MKTAIIDLGIGNIGSMYNILKHIGEEAVVVCQPHELLKAERAILPGVGSFDAGVQQIEQFGWRKALTEFVNVKKRPILGVCLGMQLLCNKSEEGTMSGLGFVDGVCKRFDSNGKIQLKVPHMGWNEANVVNPSRLFESLEMNNRFYFTHSYYVELQEKECVIASSKYGSEFTCAFQKNNILGVQFHPEKSHRYGKVLLKNFININA